MSDDTKQRPRPRDLQPSWRIEGHDEDRALAKRMAKHRLIVAKVARQNRKGGAA